MYGIVNRAIHGLVIENFGEEAWNNIKKDSGVDIDYFLSNEPYDDSVTFKLAGSASKVLNLSLNDVLIAFGEYWILNTGQKHYGSLMQSGGAAAREFLINLPHFHSRVSLIYPNLTPPEFLVNEISADKLELHYYSKRDGLTYFVVGLLSGIAKMFNESYSINITKKKSDGHDHDVFELNWNNG